MRAEGIVPEEVKEEPKPKEYSREDYEQYHKFAEEINNLFAEIILRQMNAEEDPALEAGEDPDRMMIQQKVPDEKQE
jgi:hypothetical protein